MQQMKRKGIMSFILSLAQILLAAIPLIYQFQMAEKISEYTCSIAASCIGILAITLLWLTRQRILCDYLQIAGTVFIAVGLCFFMAGGVLSLADWISDVNFWGDATQAPAIITYGCMMVCSTATGVVNCYIKKT